MRRLSFLPIVFLALSGLAECAAAARVGQALKPVKACSAYGNGCIVAPVRRARFGLEAQLKSGTWIDCRGDQPADCRDAIRDDVLDFWETQNEKALILR